GAERVLVVHHLARRHVEEPPSDRGERRRIWLRQLVVVGPAAVVTAVDPPGSGHGLPRELVVGQPFDRATDERERVLHLPGEQLGRATHPLFAPTPYARAPQRAARNSAMWTSASRAG